MNTLNTSSSTTGLHGHGEYVEHQPDASKHDKEVEKTTERRKWPQLFIPNGGHGKHRHVGGVEIAPAFNDHKARGANKKDDSKRQAAAREPALAAMATSKSCRWCLIATLSFWGPLAENGKLPVQRGEPCAWLSARDPGSSAASALAAHNRPKRAEFLIHSSNSSTRMCE